jgi:hypothetical protein
MGIERATTRWYLKRLAYESEVASLEARLSEEQNKPQGLENKERAELEKQLAQVHVKLHRLGPCPKAMMG